MHTVGGLSLHQSHKSVDRLATGDTLQRAVGGDDAILARGQRLEMLQLQTGQHLLTMNSGSGFAFATGGAVAHKGETS